MVAELTAGVIRTIRDAARRLTGAKRRQFEAQVAMDYCQAVARKAETILGWGRDTVQAGLEELPTGTARQDRYRQRGRRKTEQKLSPLEEDIRKLLDPQSQIDPKFQSSFLFTRATGKAVRESLLQNEKTYAPEEIPSARTIRRVMNRLGYRLRRVQKAKPVKRIPETDAIFEHVKLAHTQSEQQDDCLRISVDAKAKVKVGEFSRGGKARGRQAKKAGDHDMNPQATLVPFGILETTSCQLFTVFGTSRETSVSPIVRFVDKAYEKGVRLSKKSFRSFSSRLKRSDSLPKWSLEIPPVAAESIWSS